MTILFTPIPDVITYEDGKFSGRLSEAFETVIAKWNITPTLQPVFYSGNSIPFQNWTRQQVISHFEFMPVLIRDFYRTGALEEHVEFTQQHYTLTFSVLLVINQSADDLFVLYRLFLNVYSLAVLVVYVVSCALYLSFCEYKERKKRVIGRTREM